MKKMTKTQSLTLQSPLQSGEMLQVLWHGIMESDFLLRLLTSLAIKLTAATGSSIVHNSHIRSECCFFVVTYLQGSSLMMQTESEMHRKHFFGKKRMINL